jgi:hypothetical protein
MHRPATFGRTACAEAVEILRGLGSRHAAAAAADLQAVLVLIHPEHSAVVPVEWVHSVEFG